MNSEMHQLTPFDGFNEAASDFSGNGSSQGESAKPPNLFRTLHRAIRGRYWFILPLSLAFGAAGAYGGWKLIKPQYRTVGSIQIQSKLNTPVETKSSYTEAMSQYDEVLQTQCYIMTSRTIIDPALASKDWIETHRGNDRKTTDAFVEHLTVAHPQRTETIQVEFVDSDPGVACAGVKSVVTTYERWYRARVEAEGSDQIRALLAHHAELGQQIEEEKTQINEISKEFGTVNLDALFHTREAQVTGLEEKLAQAQLALALLQNKADPAAAIEGLTLNQIGILDPVMREKLTGRANTLNTLQQMSSNYGPLNPRVKELQRLADQQTSDVEQYAKEFRDLAKKMAQNGGSMPGSNGLGQYAGVTKEALEAEVRTLTAMRDKAFKEMQALGNKQQSIHRHEDKIKDLTDQLSKSDHTIALFRLEHKIGGRLYVISYGEVSIQPYKDHRPKLAAGLGLAGMSFPVMMLFLLGLTNRRYRYSDETDGATGMPPLLGILPTLPERMTDPDQAAVAAHCIHQVRIMLQVNGGTGQNGTGQRKAYMVTSASTGDGKTSLTMALGLSFAASGSRTLVVDCDMVGQGLTHRLKARQSPGLLESLAAGTMQGRVKKTTTHNLYILPVGGADAGLAGGLSPNGMKKLLAEARKIFDVIVIDTGPILGSLEAQSVGAAADGVILTVARGQLRPLVERSVRQLRTIGAHVAGIVFNRAEGADFARSVGSTSLRSVNALPQPQRAILGESAESSRFGPLARSVATFMPTEQPQKVVATPKADFSSDTVNGEAIDDDELATAKARPE